MSKVSCTKEPTHNTFGDDGCVTRKEQQAWLMRCFASMRDASFLRVPQNQRVQEFAIENFVPLPFMFPNQQQQ